MGFIQCDGEKLKGKVSDIRDQLIPLLPPAPNDDSAPSNDDWVPEFETQLDDIPDCDSGEESEESEDGGRLTVDIKSVEDMAVGEMIDVYWKGEDKWFEGEITNIELEDKTYEVFYQVDSARLWHALEDYPCRYSC